jgi:hypothetical protein
MSLVLRGRRGSSELVAALALAVSLALGCAASPPPDDGLPPPSNLTPAGTFFVTKVYPELQLTCSFCHAAPKNPVGAPQFMAFTAEPSYERLVAHPGILAQPADSALVLKGEHTGPALTATQRQLVEDRLALEVKERGLDAPSDADEPNAPAKTIEAALAEFGACMRYEDFVASKVGLLAYQQTTGWGPCRRCHSSGWGGAFIDDDEKLMFEQTRKLPFLLKYVAWTTTEKGALKDLVPSDRMRDKGVEPCTYTGKDEVLCHPKYVLLSEVDASLDAFYEATYERWKASNGACDDAPSDGAGGGP